MIEKQLFSFKEVAEFIMAFCDVNGGCWEWDLNQIPSVRKFIGLGFAKISKEYNNLYVLSESGKIELDKYVKEISKLFIDYMRINNYEQPVEDVTQWFKDELNLETLEDGKIISKYIRNHLYNYGYKVNKIRGKRYILESLN